MSEDSEANVVLTRALAWIGKMILVGMVGGVMLAVVASSSASGSAGDVKGVSMLIVVLLMVVAGIILLFIEIDKLVQERLSQAELEQQEDGRFGE